MNDRSSVLPPTPGLSASRQRVFETALSLFGERGYHAVSVRDLSESLGVQPAALYAHVTSKHELLYELIRIGYETHTEWIRGALLDSGPDPEAQIRAVVSAHVAVHLRYRDLARVVARESRCLSPDEQRALTEMRMQTNDLVTAVVQRGIKKGNFSAGVDVELALSAITAMGVRAAEWWEPGAFVPAETVAARYADYAVKILT